VLPDAVRAPRIGQEIGGGALHDAAREPARAHAVEDAPVMSVTPSITA
jgi:hypothetical protein